MVSEKKRCRCKGSISSAFKLPWFVLFKRGVQHVLVSVVVSFLASSSSSSSS